MITDDQREAIVAGVKVGGLWGGVGLSRWLASIGVTSWADFAALLTALLTLLMIMDFCWKKFIRSWAIRLGWAKANRRKVDKRKTHPHSTD